MKKYILKKDLPFAKVGTEVTVNKWNATIMDAPAPNDKGDIVLRQRIYLGDYSRLIEEGWIEEVKPREYEIQLNKSGIPIGIKYKDNLTNFFPDDLREIVKVIECFDE